MLFLIRRQNNTKNSYIQMNSLTLDSITNFSTREFRIYYHVACLAEASGDWTLSKSIPAIAEYCGVGKNSARKSIQRFCELGYLSPKDWIDGKSITYLLTIEGRKIWKGKEVVESETIYYSSLIDSSCHEVTFDKNSAIIKQPESFTGPWDKKEDKQNFLAWIAESWGTTKEKASLLFEAPTYELVRLYAEYSRT